MKGEVGDIKDETKKTKKDMEDLRKEVESLKKSVVEVTKSMKEMEEHISEMAGEFGKVAETFKSGINTTKIVNGKVMQGARGLHMYSFDEEKVKRAIGGSMMIALYEHSRMLYRLFPVLGYNGVRILSRLVRAFEQYGSVMEFMKNTVKGGAGEEGEVGREMSKIEREKDRVIKAFTSGLNGIIPKVKSFFGRFGEGIDRVSTRVTYGLFKRMGLLSPSGREGKGGLFGGMAGFGGKIMGSLPKMAGAMFGIFVVAQAIFILLKVVAMIVGEGGKMLASVLKMIKMGIVFALKPILDLLALVLLPLGIFMMVFFSQFYKDMVPYIKSFARWLKMMMPFLISVTKGVYNWLKGALAIYLGFYRMIFGSIWDGIQWLVKGVIGFWNTTAPIRDTVISIAKAIGGILTAIVTLNPAKLVENITNLLNIVSNIFGNLGKIIRDAFIGALGWLRDSIVNGIGYIIERIKESMPVLGMFQSGGYVSQTGLYLVHAGEYVVPRSDVRNIANTSSNTYNVSINVSVSGNVDVDELVSEIERRVRSVVSW